MLREVCTPLIGFAGGEAADASGGGLIHFGRSMTFKGWPAAIGRLAAFRVAGTTHGYNPGQSSAGNSKSNQIEIVILDLDRPTSELFYGQANPPQSSTAKMDTKFFLSSSLDCQWGRISQVMPFSTNTRQYFRISGLVRSVARIFDRLCGTTIWDTHKSYSWIQENYFCLSWPGSSVLLPEKFRQIQLPIQLLWHVSYT